MAVPRNIVLISIDDLRYDCLSCEPDRRWLERYGAASLVDTPTLDRVAGSGVRFDQCVSPSSYTPLSHASMLTGTYAARHQVRTFFGKLSRQVQTLAEILAARGYRTLARVEHLALKMLDITRGMEIVDEAARDEQALFDYLSSRSSRKERKFIFVHLFDVHKPYCYATGGSESRQYNQDYSDIVGDIAERNGLAFAGLLEDARAEARRVVEGFSGLPPVLQEFAEMRSLDFLLRRYLRQCGTLFQEMVPLYVRGVTRFDRGKFSDLLTRLEQCQVLDDALLVVTSDHGETRCTWDGVEDFMNSFFLLEGAIRVPLILFSPQHLPDGLVIDAPVSLVDIVPTVLDLLRVTATGVVDGLSLLPLLRGEDLGRSEVTSETWAYRGGVNLFGQVRAGHEMFLRQRCVRSRRYKLVETGMEFTAEDWQGSDDGVFVKTVYRKCLGRFETAEELSRWTASLAARAATRQEVHERICGQVVSPSVQLFDISEDPFEECDLSEDPACGEVLRQLKRRLGSAVEGVDTGLTQEETEQLTEHLRALGYL